MKTPEEYFKEHDLFNKEKLLQKAEHDLVDVIESERFPNLIMLHYRNECHFDKKWSTFARMSRGLIVDLQNQKILAYPFNKFFNVGEMSETHYDNLVSLGDFEVSEKLDGSLLILFQDPNTKKFHLTTKGSFDSDHGKFATTLLPQHLCSEKLVSRYTVMFELIHPDFQIVVDYKRKGYTPGLYLIGMRDHESNKLLSYSEIQDWANLIFKVPTFKTYKFSSLDSVIEKTKILPVLEEGYVLRYPKDLLVKIKGTEYLRVHRFISKLSDKHLLEVMIDGNIDEMINLAPEEYRDSVIEKVTMYRQKKIDIVTKYYGKLNAAPKSTRKDYALWVISNIDKPYQGLMFDLFENKPLTDSKIYSLILKNERPSSETKF